MDAITIRPLSSIDDYERAEELQLDVWGRADPRHVVPTPVLLTAQKNGGLTAGAFAADGSMLGFIFGFLGTTPAGKYKHCSHMMGIAPSVRRQNIGYRLKTFQREYVLTQGLDLITWTFDPLEGVNASLNIGKLGVIARTYFRNLYGEHMDSLNGGIPTDRFEVEWWIDSPRVGEALTGVRQRPSYAELLAAGAQPVLETRLNEQGLLQISRANLDPHLDLHTETLLLEVPAEFQAIKAASLELAQAWRLQTRQLFERLFADGYIVTDFVSQPGNLTGSAETDLAPRRNFYVLTRHVTGLTDAHLTAR